MQNFIKMPAQSKVKYQIAMACYCACCCVAGGTPTGTVTEAHITRTLARTQDMLPHQANNIS
jgi:hypothetical protein